MDAKQVELEERLAESLRQAANIASQLQAREQGPGTPHYDQIELPAHDVGRRLSRMIQQDRIGEVSAEHPVNIKCPDCGTCCSVETSSRSIQSMSGPVGLIETVAHCRPCRRSFFPSA